MNDTLTLQSIFARANVRALAAPILIVMILATMVLPLPAFLLDLFFTFNIAMSVMVLLVAMYTRHPLEFSIFPTVQQGVIVAVVDGDVQRRRRRRLAHVEGQVVVGRRVDGRVVERQGAPAIRVGRHGYGL